MKQDRFLLISKRISDVEALYRTAKSKTRFEACEESVIITEYRGYSCTIEKDHFFMAALKYCSRFKSPQGIRNSIACKNLIQEFEQIEFSGHALGLHMEVNPQIALTCLCISDALIKISVPPIGLYAVPDEIFDAMKSVIIQNKINRFKTKRKSHVTN